MTPSLEHVVKLAKEALEGYLKGENVDALPNPYSIKVAAQYDEDQDDAEPYHAVSIVEVEVEVLTLSKNKSQRKESEEITRREEYGRKG